MSGLDPSRPCPTVQHIPVVLRRGTLTASATHTVHCVLPAGHAGDHQAGDGHRWSSR